MKYIYLVIPFFLIGCNTNEQNNTTQNVNFEKQKIENKEDVSNKVKSYPNVKIETKQESLMNDVKFAKEQDIMMKTLNKHLEKESNLTKENKIKFENINKEELKQFIR